MKKLGIIAALLVLTGVFATAQNMFKNSDFSAGLAPWGLMEMQGGKSMLAAINGEMVLSVEKLGTTEYSNQIYYDGVALEKDKKYKFSFDVRCDIEREFQYQVQQNGGDYKDYISGKPSGGPYVKVGPNKIHVEKEFVMKRNDRGPRVVFNAGKWKGSTPSAHKIYFDNIVLEEVK